MVLDEVFVTVSTLCPHYYKVTKADTNSHLYQYDLAQPTLVEEDTSMQKAASANNAFNRLNFIEL